LVPTLGDHYGDWFSDIDHFINCKDRTVYLLPKGLTGQRYDQTFFGQEWLDVREAINPDNSVHLPRGVGINPRDERVGMRAAQKAGVQGAGKQNVIYKPASPNEHRNVFKSWNRLSDHSLCH
jgi:hypothetical protein